MLEKARFEHSPLGNLLSKLLGKQRDDNEQDRQEESESIEDFVERLTRLHDDIGERRDAINQAIEETSRHIQTDDRRSTRIEGTPTDDISTPIEGTPTDISDFIDDETPDYQHQIFVGELHLLLMQEKIYHPYQN